MKRDSMKKYLLIFIGLCILIFSFYAKQGEDHIKYVSRKDTITYRLDGASNTYRLEKFIDNVEKNNVDRINLVAMILGLYKAIQGVKNFVVRNKELDKKVDEILEVKW